MRINRLAGALLVMSMAASLANGLAVPNAPAVAPEAVSNNHVVVQTSTAPQTTIAPMSKVPTTQGSKVSYPKKCTGKVDKNKSKNLYFPKRKGHKRDKNPVAELVVRTSKASHGTVCAVLNPLGKYRGLAKKDRRYIGLFMCLETDDWCVDDDRGHPYEFGYFKYQAGPIQVINTNGKRVLTFGYSWQHGLQWKTKYYNIPNAAIYTKGTMIRKTGVITN